MAFACQILTNTSTTETNGSRTHTQVLGDLDEGVGHLRGVGTLGLHANGRDLCAGRVDEGRGALHGVEGGGLGGSGYASYVNGDSRRALGAQWQLLPEYARANFWSC